MFASKPTSFQSFSSGTYIALVLNATVGLATTMTPGIAKDGERKILKLLAINRGVDKKENEVEKEARTWRRGITGSQMEQGTVVMAI
jgi:hypothetical protein